MIHVCFMYDMAQTYISKLTDYKILIKNDVCYGGFLFFMVTKIIDICHKNKPFTTKKMTKHHELLWSLVTFL